MLLYHRRIVLTHTHDRDSFGSFESGLHLLLWTLTTAILAPLKLPEICRNNEGLLPTDGTRESILSARG